LETKRSDKQRDRDVEFEQIKAALDLDLTGRNSSQQPKRAIPHAWPWCPVHFAEKSGLLGQCSGMVRPHALTCCCRAPAGAPHVSNDGDAVMAAELRFNLPSIIAFWLRAAGTQPAKLSGGVRQITPAP